MLTACDRADIPSDTGAELAITVAGAPSEVSIGEKVNLTATLSVNGEQVSGATFSWADQSALSIALASSDNTAHFVAAAGVDEAVIFVTATIHGVSASETIRINIIDPAQATDIDALAITGPTSVTEGHTVILNALVTKTGAEQQDAIITWQQDGVPDVSPTINGRELSFTAPSVIQDTELSFSAQHTTDDGELFDTFRFVTIKPTGIAFTNQANTGQSQTSNSQQTQHTIKQVTSGDTVHLTAQAALVGGGTPTYAWTQNGSPTVPVTIIDPDSQTASFVAPDAGGKLSFTVTATGTVNGISKSTTQTQQVTIKPKPPAITLQGARHEVLNSGATLTLSVGVTGGTAPFTYNWQPSGAAASITLSSSTAEKPTVTLPAVSTDTDFTWAVTVTDNEGKITKTDHVVTVKAAPKLAVTILHPSNTDVAEGDTVSPQATITGGTGSYSIRWSSSLVTLTDETTETPTFVVPAIGKEAKIILNLVVSDGTDTLTQSVSYTAKPLFIINPHQNQSGSNLATGPTQSTHTNNQIVSGKTFKPSIDVHENTATGGAFTYVWTVVSPNPVPSDLVIAGANTAQPIVVGPTVTNTTPVELQAVITYTAPNGKSISKTVNSTYQIVPVNAPSKPTLSLSMAGHESVYGGRKVNPTVSVMNAAGTITYKWTQISGPTPAIVIADDTTDHPSFTTPTVSGHQDIVVQVEVSDGHSVEKAQVTFAIDPFVVPAKLPLTVVASGGSTVIANATVNPRATVTNSNGAAHYSWSQTSGPAITITNPSSATPSFTAPAVSGTVVVEVSVTDADNSPVTGTITYQIQTAIKVKASASTNDILEGGKLDLVATSSDVNGTASYAWSVVSDGGTGIVTADITPAAMAQASIDIPAVDQDRVLVLQVVATDSANAQTATSQVTVDITDRHMRIDLGADAHIPTGQTGNLHTNVQGGLAPFTYSWTDSNPATLVGGPTDTGNPSFTAPTVIHSVDLQFDVTVTDSLNNTARDSITMTVDQPPFSVDAGVDFSVTEGVTVQLGATDLNGTGTTWSWSQTAGQTVSLSNDTIDNPTFTAPAQGANSKETFSFTVTGTSNGQAKSDSVNVVVQGVPDIAAHTNNVSVHAGATVTLAGSVTGPGTVTKLEWSQTSSSVSVGPLTNAIVTGDVKALNATFVAPAVNADTTLTFDFLATGTGNSNHVSATVTIIANPLSVSAGSDIRVKSGATLQLQAVSSNAANYAWSQTAGTPTVTLINGNTNGASFVAPDVTADTTLTFQVDATGGGLPSSDTVDVIVYEPTIVVKTGKPHRINLVADDSEPPTWIDTTFADTDGNVVTPATTTWTITPKLTPQATMDAVFVDLDQPSLQITPLLASKGTYTATMTAGDSANHFQAGSKSFVINIQPATPPMPKTIDLSANTGLTGIAGVAGKHCLHAPTITGGASPYTYNWGLGADTNGLTLTGGTTDNPCVTIPAVPNTCTEIKGKISLTITDANGDTSTGDVAYSSTPALNPISPVSCHICRGPKFICERSHVSTVCDVSLGTHALIKDKNGPLTDSDGDKARAVVNSDLQYCINDIENLKDGSRYVTRRCATAEEVNSDWFGSDPSKITPAATTGSGGAIHANREGQTTGSTQAYQYNVVILQDAHFSFSVACQGDDCNLETMPDHTLGLLPSYAGTPQYVPEFPNGKIDTTINSVPPTPAPGVCP